MKPDWKDAPAWSKFLAMDDDGRWYWYSERPTLRLGCWKPAPHSQFGGATPVTIDVVPVIEERP